MPSVYNEVMEMNFCRRCGTKLISESEGAFKCEQGHVLYINPAPAVAVFFISEKNELLLSVRGIEPFKGTLDAFGGFVDEFESFEEALTREIKEELRLEPHQYEKPRYLFSGTFPYPYGNETRTVLGTVFWTRLKAGAQPIASDDVAEIRYMPLEAVDLSRLSHPNAQKGIQKLKDLFL